MKARCTNPKHKRRNDYGGRGIKLCERWYKFINFYEDMIESYNKHIELFGEKETTIDRIDNNGNYCKENCKRSTYKEQANNKRFVGNKYVNLSNNLNYSLSI